MSISNKVLQYQHRISSVFLIFMFECYTQNALKSQEVPIQKEKGGCVMLSL